MQKILLIIIFLGTILNAMPTVNIDKDNVKIEDFNLEYIITPNEDNTLDNIKNKTFKFGNNKMSFGINTRYVWLRFNIKNKTDKKQVFFLNNEFAYAAQKINFYVLKNNQVYKKLNIDFINDKNAKEKMSGAEAIVKIDLESNETSTIYIQSTMLNTFAFKYNIYTQENDNSTFVSKNIYIIMILGMFFSLTIYHLILFVSTRYIEYLYYSLHLISITIWNLQSSGFLAERFSFYYDGKNDHLLLIMLLSSIFLVMFAKRIFNTTKKYIIEDKFLNSILVLSIGIFLISIFNLNLAIKVGLFLYIYIFIVFFIVSYFIMKKGNPLALIFLIGNGSFCVFALYTDLFYLGFIQFSYSAFYSASMGMLIEIFVLAYILSYRFRLLQLKEITQTKKLTRQVQIKKMNKLLESKLKSELEKSKEKDKMIFQENKRASMGEMIENITHQWRQPLNKINSSVFVIDTYINRKEIEKDKIFEELDQIEKTTKYMSETLDVFRNFFDKNKKKEKFSLLTTIDDTKSILINSNITITITKEESKKYICDGYEDELIQVLMIIVNNAKDALLSNNIAKPLIKIELKESEKYFLINIIDNAKGINENIIEKIFDPYFTTKHKSQGTGLGLYISKVIIEEHFQGSLKAANIKEGAKFTIKLLKKDKS